MELTFPFLAVSPLVETLPSHPRKFSAKDATLEFEKLAYCTGMA